MTKYLKWKWASDAWFFEYYNSEDKTTNKYSFDEIAVKNVSYTVKGWDDAGNLPIYSNDIESFREGENELKVRTKTGVLYEWPYNKEAIEATGGKIHIKVIGVDNKWEEVEITLKWTNFFNLSEVLKTFDTKAFKLAFDKTEDWKKWAVKYKSVFFKKGSAIEEEISVEDIPF